MVLRSSVDGDFLDDVAVAVLVVVVRFPEGWGRGGKPDHPRSSKPRALGLSFCCRLLATPDWPVGFSRRLIARIGESDDTTSRHLPLPSLKAPVTPLPASRSAALKLRAAPAGTDTSTSLPGVAPSSIEFGRYRLSSTSWMDTLASRPA